MIFLSYRIKDSFELVDRLDTDLTRDLGRAALFRDKSRLEPGPTDWTDQLTERAKGCRVMLVLIGPAWHDARYDDPDRSGELRLDDPKDWVRLEITLALDAGAVIVPVFLNGASLPAVGWLKRRGLEGLHGKMWLTLRTAEYAADYAKLLGAMRKLCPELSTAAVIVTPTAPPKAWRPMVAYPLQPAPHFEGRVALRAELAAWAIAADDPNRVVALVAAGGTGKTALAERVLDGLRDHAASGVFVWSFYEDPKTESFLRAACKYFLGEAPKESGGLLERLQHGLRVDDLPHLLIFDGLEVVQVPGKTGGLLGELEDPLLRRSLR